jgi:phosphoglycerate dehydrogenase-like enzyme
MNNNPSPSDWDNTDIDTRWVKNAHQWELSRGMCKEAQSSSGVEEAEKKGKKPKVLLVHSPGMWNITDGDLKELRRNSELVHMIPKSMTQEKLASLCKGVDHLMLNIDCIETTAEKMERIDEKFYSNKNVQQLKTMNVDMSDLDYFSPKVIEKHCKNLILQSVPNDYGNCAVAENVAESAVSEIMLHAKNRHLAYVDVANGKPADCRPGMLLKGNVAGVVGYGRIGTRVAKKLEALGMKVMVHDVKKINRDNSSLKEIFKKCKAISIHVPTVMPDGDSNVDLIDSDLLGLCEGTILINLATDVIVNSKAVARAIKDKKLIGYSCEPNYGSAKFAEKNYLPVLEKHPEFHLAPCSSGFGTEEVSIQMKTGWISNTLSAIRGKPENVWNTEKQTKPKEKGA